MDLGEVGRCYSFSNVSNSSAGFPFAAAKSVVFHGEVHKPQYLISPPVLHAGMGYEDARYSRPFPSFYLSIVWPV